jgi:uncharacterized membrane protein YkoI
MPYKVLHINEADYKTFKQLKHRLEIDSDVKTFHKLMEIIQNNLNGNTVNSNEKESECDGIAG